MTRAARRKYHITYKTTCMITGRYYIGMHSTDILEDGYLGSGVRLVRSVKKHGKEQHQREILSVFATRLEASEHEKSLITEEVRRDPMSLNCGVGGLGATDRSLDTEETRQRRSEASLKMHAGLSDEQRDARARAISVANKIALNKPQTKRAQSEAGKKRWENEAYREFHTTRMRERKHTDEARAKMANAKLGKKLKRSPEHNAKIAAAHRARWSKIKGLTT